MPIQTITGSDGEKIPLPKRGIRKKSKGVVKGISFEKKGKLVENLKEKLPTKKPVKKPKKKEVDKGGRPTVFTNDLLQVLELCFMVGMNDREACIFSEIAEASLYNYQKENPEFLEKKKLWKNKITLQAIINLGKDIKEGDNSTSKWWLERRAKDKFGNSIGITDDTDKPNEITPEEEAMHARILNFKSLQKGK